jgi:hypothetical protein
VGGRRSTPHAGIMPAKGESSSSRTRISTHSTSKSIPENEVLLLKLDGTEPEADVDGEKEVWSNDM